jgi:hypothetical protein
MGITGIDFAATEGIYDSRFELILRRRASEGIMIKSQDMWQFQ